MASTPSPSLRLELMATGDQSGTWGDTTNVNLGTLLEQAITGYLSIAKTDATDYTLTNTDYAINETRNAVIEFTGSPGNVFNVITPAAEKTWLFKNSTNQTMTVKVSGQTGVAVPAGTAKLLYCDGTDVEEGLAIPTTYFTSTSTALSPTANDAQTLGTSSLQWGDLYLASGGFIDFANNDVRITQSTNTLAFSGASSGYTVDAVLKPATNGGAALGESGTAFSNLFLASGGVINFDAGDVTITHSANTLAFAGATSYTFNGGTAYFAGGTDVALADGGTGASLTDPNADRIMFWDDSAGAVTWLTAGSGLTITDTTLSVSASSPFTAVGNGVATNTQTFNATGTWTKPGAGTQAVVLAWGGGGGGSWSGGGGGAFTATIVPLSSLGATVAVTIGAGGTGTDGNQGGNAAPGGTTSFGTFAYAYGGGGGGDERWTNTNGQNQTGGEPAGGGGGGSTGTGGTGSTTNGGNTTSPVIGTGGTGGSISGLSIPVQSQIFSGATVNNALGFVSLITTAGDAGSPSSTSANSFGGAGGAGYTADTVLANAGNAVWGGGGGGTGINTTYAAGGTSNLGGSGGNANTNTTGGAGAQPGGGGGGSGNNIGGAGGAGKVIVYVY